MNPFREDPCYKGVAGRNRGRSPAAKGYQNFLEQMRGWKIVLLSLAGTVLLVGGVGVLSVMLISFSDRRFEIGLRKALGASDQEIFIQFLIEAVVFGLYPAFRAMRLSPMEAMR